MYEDLAINAFRFLGCKSFKEINQMTLREFELRMIAFKLSQVDEDMKRHEQAFLNNSVRARDRKGNAIYKEFIDFYDYEERINEALEGTDFHKSKLDEKRINELKQIARNLREYREGRGRYSRIIFS
ncbi:hypothetical protein AUF15_08145 [Enterococcus avium]|nr:hypothetical protein AUF15_08145 [Enterococcus avium]